MRACRSRSVSPAYVDALLASQVRLCIWRSLESDERLPLLPHLAARPPFPVSPRLADLGRPMRRTLDSALGEALEGEAEAGSGYRDARLTQYRGRQTAPPCEKPATSDFQHCIQVPISVIGQACRGRLVMRRRRIGHLSLRPYSTFHNPSCLRFTHSSYETPPPPAA